MAAMRRPTGFLNLPYELRVQIYSHYFKDLNAPTHLFNQTDESSAILHPVYGATLLRACKNTRRETLAFCARQLYNAEWQWRSLHREIEAESLKPGARSSVYEQCSRVHVTALRLSMGTSSVFKAWRELDPRRIGIGGPILRRAMRSHVVPKGRSRSKCRGN